MKLHHRVTVKPSRFLSRRLEHHAIDCIKLYRWNRETAWPCRCDHGLIDGVECPICLGKGFSA